MELLAKNGYFGMEPDQSTVCVCARAREERACVLYCVRNKGEGGGEGGGGYRLVQAMVVRMLGPFCAGD